MKETFKQHIKEKEKRSNHNSKGTTNVKTISNYKQLEYQITNIIADPIKKRFINTQHSNSTPTKKKKINKKIPTKLVSPMTQEHNNLWI